MLLEKVLEIDASILKQRNAFYLTKHAGQFLSIFIAILGVSLKN